jgi:hypothetical protein
MTTNCIALRGEPSLVPLVGKPFTMVSPGLKPRKARVFRHTLSCGRGRRCLPKGKRSPPPATPSFKVENTVKAIKKEYFHFLKPEAFLIPSRSALFEGRKNIKDFTIDFDVALARTEGVGESDSDPDSVSRPRRSRRAGNTGSALPRARRRRAGGHPSGCPPERPEVDLLFLPFFTNILCSRS